MKPRPKPALMLVIAGWAIHFYTATGLLIAAWIALLLSAPQVEATSYQLCFLLMFVATFIDATDGTLARMVRIKETIPSFDGRRLDDLVDFLMYACLPFWLIFKTGLLGQYQVLLLFGLMASGYGFCQTNIKSPNGSFVGFPSYWNIVAFYLYTLNASPIVSAGLIVFFGILTFVPSCYYYPTQPGWWNRLMLLLSIPWAIALLALLVKEWTSPPQEMTDTWVPLTCWLSLIYPGIYLFASWSMSLRRVWLGIPQSRLHASTYVDPTDPR